MKEYANDRTRLQEHELVEIVTKFLLGAGYRVRTEVSNLGQSADLVATRGRWVTFVEVKVRDWRTALAQCNAHMLVGDYICVAVATKNISASLREAAAEMGVGIIHVSPVQGCSWIAMPKLNQTMWKPQRKQFSQTLQAIAYVD